MSALDPLTRSLAGGCLIEASAGTGKTWAITSLVLRLLLGHDGARTGTAPLRIEQILIVTFTRAATEELRGRIRKRLLEARRAFAEGAGPAEDEFIRSLHAQSSDRAEDYARLCLAEASLDLASVFTIHGFATRVLERNAFESRASFAATISEDDKAVVRETLRDLWRERVYPLPTLPAGFVLQRHATVDGFVALTGKLIHKTELEFDNVPARDWDSLLRACIEGEHVLLETWQAGGQQLRAELRDAPLKAEGRRALATSLRCLDAATRNGLDARALNGLSRRYLFSELMVKAKGKGLPDSTLLDQADALLELAPQLQARLLYDAVLDARARLAALKARTALLGYEDLLRLLWEGLAAEPGGDALARAIRDQYPVALIDECQDTDPLQWRVFERIYRRDGALFLVGDPKQAIYAFRGADVYAYLRLRAQTQDWCTLEVNYRSVRPLVEALNALFSLREDGDAFRAQGMRYIEVEPSDKPDLKPLAHDGERVPALQLIWQQPGEQVAAEAYRDYMADAAAAQIASMLADADAGRLTLDGKKLEPGHIACLVRGWPDAEPLAGALRRRGVPYVYRGRDSVYAAPAARDLYRLLRAVLEPRAERCVRAALAGALLARDAVELEAWLGDEQALLHWQDRFALYREQLRVHGVQAALRALLLELDAPRRLLALPDGERRLTDCLHLVELLAVERAGLDDDEALLNRLGECIANADAEREEQQLRLESDAKRVRIVTLHASKGLQYEVVFLPFIATRRSADSPLYHAADTLEPRYDLLESDEALARADEERMAEELRLLYVGLTRAVHCCVLGVADVLDGRRRVGMLAESALGWLLEAEKLEPRQALQRLAGLPGVLMLSDVDARLGPERDTGQETLQARRFTGTIVRDWRASSYSALAHGGARDEKAERVFRQPELLGATREAGHAREPTVFTFRRGPEYGNLLHGLLEKAELAEPAGSELNAALIDLVLERGGLGTEWRATLGGMLEDAAGCALDGEQLRLGELPAAARVAEMGFELPLARIDAHALNRLLIAHEPLSARAAPLDFSSLKGMLSGFIDLVFEYRGRYYVADWKSNHLGNALEDYTRSRLEQSIVAHRYDLQYVLYTLALVRYLRARLGPRFDYELHVGGVYYLFLRGMRRAHGNAYGVFHTRPPRALIEAIDRLFAEGT